MLPCPFCGNQLPAEASFCSGCLRPVTGAAEPPAGSTPWTSAPTQPLDDEARSGPRYEPPLPPGPGLDEAQGYGYGYPPPGAGYGPTPGYGPTSGYGYPPANHGPGYAPPPGYGYPPGYGGWAPAAASTNGMAIGSLVCSIAGLLSCGLLGVVGVVLGHLAVRQINRSGGTEGGRGLAIAGLAIGYLGLVGWMVFFAWAFSLPGN